VDPELLRVYDLTLGDVEKAVGEALEFSALPYSKHAKLQTEGSSILPISGSRSATSCRSSSRWIWPGFPRGHDGKSVLLGKVAEVKWDTWPMIGDAVVNGGPGLMMIVEKLPWANTWT